LPEEAARMLDGRVAWREQRQGEWVAVIELDRLLKAKNTSPRINADER
jgi:hypothetical protein